MSGHLNFCHKDTVSTGKSCLRLFSKHDNPTILKIIDLVRMGQMVLSTWRLSCDQSETRRTALNGKWQSYLEASSCCSSKRDRITGSLTRMASYDSFLESAPDLAPTKSFVLRNPLS